MSGPTIKIAGQEIDVQELERCVAGYPEKLAQIHKRFAKPGEYVWGHTEEISSVIFCGPDGVRTVSSESHEDLMTLPDSAIIITGPEGGNSQAYGLSPLQPTSKTKAHAGSCALPQAELALLSFLDLTLR